jgi:hypothetical protein
MARVGLFRKESVVTDISDADTNDTNDELLSSKTPPCSLLLLEQQQPLLVFDWDDTLLPTSFLAAQGLRVDGPLPGRELQRQLDELSESIRETMLEAQRHGNVILVTNAERGWIELTVRRFLPRLAGLVLGLRQVSARSAFEPQGVKAPVEWKERAFLHLIDEHTVQCGNAHVVSFGDSAHERDAVIKVCAEIAARKREDVLVRCKSLKFMERPDIEQLKKEHSLIRQCLAQIVAHPDSLDLCIQTSPSSPPPSSSSQLDR